MPARTEGKIRLALWSPSAYWQAALCCPPFLSRPTTLIQTCRTCSISWHKPLPKQLCFALPRELCYADLALQAWHRRAPKSRPGRCCRGNPGTFQKERGGLRGMMGKWARGGAGTRGWQRTCQTCRRSAASSPSARCGNARKQAKEESRWAQEARASPLTRTLMVRSLLPSATYLPNRTARSVGSGGSTDLVRLSVSPELAGRTIDLSLREARKRPCPRLCTALCPPVSSAP